MRTCCTLLAAAAAAAPALGAAPAAPGSSPCRPSELAASLVGAGVGLGNAHAHVYLRNTSARTCVLRGYLGFELQTEQHRVQPSRVTHGSTYFQDDPGPHPIILGPGAGAVADLAWTEVAAPDEPHSGACEPPSAWLEVTPPDARSPLLVRFGASVCDHGRLRTTALTTAPARPRRRSPASSTDPGVTPLSGFAAALPSVSRFRWTAPPVDTPRLVPWTQVGDISFGMTRAEVEREYGTAASPPKNPIHVYVGRGRIGVSFDRAGHAVGLETKSAVYASSSGIHVGMVIPLGRCRPVSPVLAADLLLPHRSCHYRWRNLVYKENTQYLTSGTKHFGEWDALVATRTRFHIVVQLFVTRGIVTEIWMARVLTCPGGGGTMGEICKLRPNRTQRTDVDETFPSPKGMR